MVGRRGIVRPVPALVLIALTCALVPACQKRPETGPQIEVQMHVTPDPPTVGTEQLDLELREPGGAAIEGAQVKIEGNMSHPGMTPVFADASEVAPGVYRANLELTMAGDWILEVNVQRASGRTVRQTLQLPGVRNR